MAKHLHPGTSVSAPDFKPRKRVSLTWPGFASLVLLLLGAAFYFYQTGRPAVQSPPQVLEPAGAVPPLPDHPGFPTSADLASHPLFAPLTGTSADSLEEP
ncbi:hypothetical protein [Rufibacter quisquiliarum]|uniref:Uncharacterized protein n=1 Tax=Rufibacter quisquiliarum TaxID=1549639 RepID=A0A839GM56_9BACT|nr:hypothetical protein [Rufibacter quisquiliarum]MBA9076056.1 hypothetical protein [Rufibacter quisquiliarum]